MKVFLSRRAAITAISRPSNSMLQTSIVCGGKFFAVGAGLPFRSFMENIAPAIAPQLPVTIDTDYMRLVRITR